MISTEALRDIVIMLAQRMGVQLGKPVWLTLIDPAGTELRGVTRKVCKFLSFEGSTARWERTQIRVPIAAFGDQDHIEALPAVATHPASPASQLFAMSEETITLTRPPTDDLAPSVVGEFTIQAS